MLARFIFILGFYLILQPTVLAVECAAVFSDGLQNNNNGGEITFNDQAKVLNSPDNILDSKNAIVDGSGGVSCDTGVCTSSGNIAQVVNIDDFGNSNTDISHYNIFTPKTITPGDYNKLTLGVGATLVLTAGDYRFKGDFSVGWMSQITISGTDVVRIFLKKSPQLSSSININETGTGNQLLFYSKEVIQVLSNSTFNAFIYSKKDVVLNSQSSVDGAISGKNITLVSEATVDFFAADTDFGDFCSSSAPPPPIDYCDVTFVSGVTSFDSGGKIEFDGFPTISNNGSAALVINEIKQSNDFEAGDTLTCTGFGDCTASATTTQPLDLGSFIDNQGGDSFTLSAESITIGSDVDGANYNTDNFNEILIGNGGNLTFSSTNYQTYYIKKLKVLDGGGFPSDSTATINLTPGDYYIGEFKSKLNTTINVIGDGAVRLFLKGHSDFEGNTRGNIGGAAEDFIVYGFNDFHIKNNTEFHGLVYAQNNVDLKDSAKIVGAISAKKIKLTGTPQVYYTCDVEPPTDLALYRFEQTDFSTQIDDTSGEGNHADNTFLGASIADGKYCRGFGDSSWNKETYTGSALRSRLDLDEDVGIEGTISFWFNSSIDWDDGEEEKRILFDATANLSPSNDQGQNKFFALEIIKSGELKFSINDSDENVLIINEPWQAQKRLADTWYYVTATWDLTTDTYNLYVDGNIITSQNHNSSGNLIDLGLITFGDNASTYAELGNTVVPSPVSSRGKFDEVRIYNRILNQADIQTDMNDDNGCAAELIAHYQMDELAWSGADNEVLNELGTLHGKAYGGATTDRINPAREFNPGTCGYGDFNGTNQYLEVADDPALDLPDQLTISAWIYPTKLPTTPSDLMTILSKDENYEFHVTPSGEINWWWETHELTTTGANITANKWHHITITYKNEEQIIYVNGLENIRSTHSGQLILNDDPLQVGQDQFQTYRYFQGNIDEVKIYSGALPATEVNAIFLEEDPCASFIDHFQIDTKDQQGVTCQADEIIIKACADASCSIINPDAVDVQLLIDNVDYKTVTVSGAAGTTTTYPYTTVGNAALSLDQTYKCTNTLGTEPCNVAFSDSAFLFSNIPSQISGKSSDVGFDASTLTLQAIETDSNTGSCVGSFPNGGDVQIDLSYSCDDGSCSEALILSNNSTDSLVSQILTPHSIRFGVDSTATFAINYPDAGQLILNAEANVNVKDADGNDVLDGNGDPIIKTLVGNSNTFVERPFGFFINAINNGKATDADGDVFTKSGEDFSVQLKAVVWQSADDQDNNGVPDIGADLSNNAVTAGFGHENTAETAIISHELVAPLPGINGDLISSTFTFINGIANDNEVNYNEVGIISFVAKLSDNSYLGSSDVQGNEPYVGRFIPSHFEVSALNDGILTGTCSIADTTEIPFVYSGQMLSDSPTTGALHYLVEPSLTVTAKSSICSTDPDSCTTTQNYTGDFIKLSTSSFDRILPLSDAIQSGKDITNLVALTANFDIANIAGVNGQVTYTYSGNDHYAYLHESNGEIDEFTSIIDLSMVSIIDSDLVETLDNEVDKVDVIVTLNPAGKLIRFGRAQLDNSYGPETSDLPQPLSVNYFDGGQYKVADNDLCTPYSATNMTITNTGVVEPLPLPSPLPTEPLASGAFIDEVPAGISRAIILTAPGAGNTGQVCVSYAVDLLPWLQYKWATDAANLQCAFTPTDVDGLFNDNPFSVATFGIYRGNDRIIYQREIEKRN